MEDLANQSRAVYLDDVMISNILLHYNWGVMTEINVSMTRVLMTLNFEWFAGLDSGVGHPKFASGKGIVRL